MKRTYTLFVATKELLTCPEIYQHAKDHHIILHPSENRTLNIVCPLERPLGALTDAHVSYDPTMLDIQMVHLMVEINLLYITIKLRAHDVGQTDISLILPEAEPGLLPSSATSQLITS
ncbi:hypothetical protein CL655_03570 [bacterium]|nr:hypothetical protein [bacterium]|tara:strand:+ start:523 stop:876 length:354 start_codon:yes stop_codon:yes gene_type:complete